jgi:hypothetical protein
MTLQPKERYVSPLELGTKKKSRKVGGTSEGSLPPIKKKKKLRSKTIIKLMEQFNPRHLNLFETP